MEGGKEGRREGGKEGRREGGMEGRAGRRKEKERRKRGKTTVLRTSPSVFKFVT